MFCTFRDSLLEDETKNTEGPIQEGEETQGEAKWIGRRPGKKGVGILSCLRWVFETLYRSKKVCSSYNIYLVNRTFLLRCDDPSKRRETLLEVVEPEVVGLLFPEFAINGS